MPFKPVGSSVFGHLIRSHRYIHSVGKFSIRALNCSWQEFGRGMRLSKFCAQLGQCAKMLPSSSFATCHLGSTQVWASQHTSWYRGFFGWFHFFTFYSSGSNSRAPELRRQCTCSLQQAHITLADHLKVLSRVFLGACVSMNSLWKITRKARSEVCPWQISCNETIKTASGQNCCKK